VVRADSDKLFATFESARINPEILRAQIAPVRTRSIHGMTMTVIMTDEEG
jgi:hypothetical protein